MIMQRMNDKKKKLFFATATPLHFPSHLFQESYFTSTNYWGAGEVVFSYAMKKYKEQMIAQLSDDCLWSIINSLLL